MPDFILATRGSELARVQARMVREGLERAHPQLAVREEIVRTTGDRHPTEELTSLGGSGVFTKELETMLLARRAHAAVHSLKDLPVELPAGLVLGAVLRRGDADDLLISAHAGGPDGLPPNARIGTGSPRRARMMRALRSDVDVAPIRGNVPTRIARVAEGKFDAVILAAAGLARLGFPTCSEWTTGEKTLYVCPLPTFLPAPGQGAIAVEVCADDAPTRETVRVLNDADTDAAVRAERSVLRALGGGCHLALGALGRVVKGQLHLSAIYFDGPDSPPKTASLHGPLDNPEELGRAVAAILHK